MVEVRISEVESDLRALIELDPTVVPDYSPKAISLLSEKIPNFRGKLGAIDRAQLGHFDKVHLCVVEAQINGLELFLHALSPFARDPSFYLCVFRDQSDTAEHEGQYAMVIDLWRFRHPLSAADGDRLGRMLETVAPLLEQARLNLTDSQAHDLFVHGVRGFRDQAAVLRALGANTLVCNTLDGQFRVDLSRQESRLLPVIDQAALATDAFGDWVEREAGKRAGPSGIGKDAYSWAAKNVHLLPYDWDAQVVCLQRELDRAWSSLAVEEFRNRALPPMDTIEDADAHAELMTARAERLTSFLIDGGWVTDRPWYRAAIPQQHLAWTPPEKRDFFRHIVAMDPLPLQTHFYHWIDLARVANEPKSDALRRRAPLFNVWQDRCEGMATAVEELMLHAGLYDELPRSRELVWIMLANRAARGLASLYVQANEMTLEEAGRFHARWTPRHLSDPGSHLVAFEQLLYARQPGYGASYVLGKLELDKVIARYTKRAAEMGKTVDTASLFHRIADKGFLPFSLIETELLQELQ